MTMRRQKSVLWMSTVLSVGPAINRSDKVMDFSNGFNANSRAEQPKERAKCPGDTQRQIRVQQHEHDKQSNWTFAISKMSHATRLSLPTHTANRIMSSVWNASPCDGRYCWSWHIQHTHTHKYPKTRDGRQRKQTLSFHAVLLTAGAWFRRQFFFCMGFRSICEDTWKNGKEICLHWAAAKDHRRALDDNVCVSISEWHDRDLLFVSVAYFLLFAFVSTTLGRDNLIRRSCRTINCFAVWNAWQFKKFEELYSINWKQIFVVVGDFRQLADDDDWNEDGYSMYLSMKWSREKWDRNTNTSYKRF